MTAKATTFEPADSYPIPDPYDKYGTAYGQGDHEWAWASHFFTDFKVPSAQGGFDYNDGYGEGLITCRECQAAVRVSGQHDIAALNVHRAWHDRVDG